MRNFVKSQVLSSKLQLAAVAFAIWTLGFGIFVNAQGRGGRGGGEADPGVPTEKQWAESAETQRRVATAMKLAGSDLLPQAKMFCTATGPLRLALARQAAGLPRSRTPSSSRRASSTTCTSSG